MKLADLIKNARTGTEFETHATIHDKYDIKFNNSTDLCGDRKFKIYEMYNFEIVFFEIRDNIVHAYIEDIEDNAVEML